MNTKKTYMLTEKSIEVIDGVKAELGFKTETAALTYIINEYEKSKAVNDKLDSLSNALTRIRLGTRTAEHNSIIIKDILNTFLQSQKISWEPWYCDDEFLKHKLVREIEGHLNEKLSQYKQVKDNAASKRGE